MPRAANPLDDLLETSEAKELTAELEQLALRQYEGSARKEDVDRTSLAIKKRVRLSGPKALSKFVSRRVKGNAA